MPLPLPIRTQTVFAWLRRHRPGVASLLEEYGIDTFTFRKLGKATRLQFPVVIPARSTDARWREFDDPEDGSRTAVVYMDSCCAESTAVSFDREKYQGDFAVGDVIWVNPSLLHWPGRYNLRQYANVVETQATIRQRRNSRALLQFADQSTVWVELSDLQDISCWQDLPPQPVSSRRYCSVVG